MRKAAVLALVSMNDPATLDPLIAQFEKEKNDDTRLDIVRAVAAVPSPKSQAFLTTISGRQASRSDACSKPSPVWRSCPPRPRCW